MSRSKQLAICIATQWLLALVGCEMDMPAERVDYMSIASLKSFYRGYPVELTTNSSIGGVVVSTDRHGEHYHRLVLQDHTGGIVVCIDCDSLYTHYSVGDQLVVGLVGLTLGGYGGQPMLGGEPVGERQVSNIDWSHWQAICHSVGVVPNFVPQHLHIADLGPRDVATRVVVQRARFVEAGQQWADEGVAQTRHLVDEDRPTDTLDVRASGRSQMWWYTIPEGVWSVEGVVGLFGGRYQLVVDSPDGAFLVSDQK